MKKLLLLCLMSCSVVAMQKPAPAVKIELPGRDYDRKLQNQFVDAVRQGNYAQVQRMLKFRPKISVTAIDDNNENPLEVAVIKKYHKIVELLLNNGVNANTNTTGGLTPSKPLIVVAVENGDADMVEILLAHGAKIDLALTGNAKNTAVRVNKKLIDLIPANHQEAERIKELLQGKTKIR